MGRLRKKEAGRPGPLRAYTLVELMITLAIGASILSTAVIYLRGYFPRMRLNQNALNVRNFLVRGQLRAKELREPHCVTLKWTPVPIVFTLYLDKSEDRICGNSTDLKIDSLTLHKKLTIPSCSSSASEYFTEPLTLFFNANGGLEFFDASGGPYYGLDVNMIFATSEMATKTFRAREVEILGTYFGEIDLVPQGKQGRADTAIQAGARPTPYKTGVTYCPLN